MKQRSRNTRKRGDVAIGLAWYRESDWARVKTEFPDAGDLHDTYAEWHESAESVIRHLKRNGVAAQPVVIDIDHFIAWCAAHDHRPDAEARSAYVAEMFELRRQAAEVAVKSSST
jgi:hypothetical protein